MSGKAVTMELDTGAAAACLHDIECDVQEAVPHLNDASFPVSPEYVLRTHLKGAGRSPMNVAYRNQSAKSLSFVIIDGDGPTLLGRDWLKFIKLDWKHYFQRSIGLRSAG